MRRSNPQTELSEAEIGRRLLKIYETLGWEVPGQQQKQTKDGRVPQPASTRDTTVSTQQSR
jgi:hypothetical protein